MRKLASTLVRKVQHVRKAMNRENKTHVEQPWHQAPLCAPHDNLIRFRNGILNENLLRALIICISITQRTVMRPSSPEYVSRSAGKDCQGSP